MVLVLCAEVKILAVGRYVRILEEEGEQIGHEFESSVMKKKIPVSAHRLSDELVRKVPVANRSAEF